MCLSLVSKISFVAYGIGKKSTIHQVTTILATSKNVLFPGPNHS